MIPVEPSLGSAGSVCPGCGGPLVGDADCPSCLLGLGIETPAEATAHPERIGPYRVLDTLGQGGMGIVYLAEQERPIRRRVALKVIKPGMDSGQVLQRFESERQALALMAHPNVAKVFDAGVSEDGRPYFVLELVAGDPINHYCDRERLSVRARLDLFLQTCDALQHAHQKGIIHRDVKPSNLLVCVEGERPTVKVIDFGVAKALHGKLTERTLQTQLGVVLGTPEYMSPEQAGATALDLDTRTDLYSLGVVLYELLVGALPFDPKELRISSDAEVLRIIREVEPPRPVVRLRELGPSALETARRRDTDLPSLSRLVSGELEWIVLKALEKERGRRYASASELAADLRRFLADEPVLARPHTTWYRVRKLVRRNRGVVIAAGAVVLALAAGLVVSTVLYFRAAQARDEARRETAKARAINDFLSQMMTSAQPGQSGDDARVVDVLAAGASQIDSAFADEPDVRAALHGTLADVYTALARFDEAVPHWRAVIEYRERTLGSGNVETLEARKGYAYMCFEAHRYDQAIDGFEKTLADATRSLGPTHRTTIDAMALLGDSYSLVGRQREAESLLREALDRNERWVGAEDRQTIENMQSLAYLYYNEHRLDEAATLDARVYETNQRIRAVGHWQRIRSAEEYARILIAQGRLDDAERVLDDTLDVARRELGEAHIQTLTTTTAVAELKLARGDFAEAERLAGHAADVFRRTDFGGGLLPMALRELTMVLAEQRRDEAVDVGREAVEAGRRSYADAASPLLARVLRACAVALYMARSRSDATESARAFGEALDIYRSRFGGDHVTVAETLVAWARMEHFNGRHEDAVAKYREALDIFDRLGWSAPYTTGEIRSELGRCLLDLGQAAAAEPFLVDGYETLRNKRGIEDGIAVEALDRLAKLYDETGRPDRAAQLRHDRPTKPMSFPAPRTITGMR